MTAPGKWDTIRLEVPGGYLYRMSGCAPMTFVPDYRLQPVLSPVPYDAGWQEPQALPPKGISHWGIVEPGDGDA